MPKASDRIGPYQLIHKLGAGGFGEVWLAQDFSGSSPREVAVKTPLNSEIDLDALLQEATIWARASGHLNVLEFLAARVFDGRVVLVSEYAPDGSLKDWLSRHGGRAPSIEAAVEMTRGILAGLEHLHARGITHRDIKPENVLLLDVTPRLADFGISRVLKSTGKNTFIAGTPHYMAPEAFNRRRNQQADLWSVGVMLYQMLSGRLPFDGNDWAELYGAILNEIPDPLPAGVPEWLRQVVAIALTKEPERRYQSAQEMREALRQFERDIEAQIAERERREVERKHLEEEERKKLEQEARQREEERKRREEEARQREEERKRRLEEDRQREIERQRLIEQQGKPEEGARHKRRLLIAGAALATTMVVAYLIGSYQITPEQQTQPTSPTPPAQLDTFSFETVTVDRNGREISRETKRARYFTVELGAGVTLEMVEIPSGYFVMGSPSTEANRGSDEGPRHLVNVPSFWMGKFKVTQKQWMALMGSNPSYFKGDDTPVDNVSWNDAQEFLAALNRRLGLQDKDRRYQYRLPSEAEWEYAARAGTDTPFAYGDRIPSQIVDDNILGIANAFGLFKMHSDPEWCEDVYHKDYKGAPTDGSAWLSGGDSSRRVQRGGSNGASARHWRSAVRHSSEPDGRYVNQWFRVVVSTRIS